MISVSNALGVPISPSIIILRSFTSLARTPSSFYSINFPTKSFNIFELSSKWSIPSVNSAKLINPWTAASLISFFPSKIMFQKSSINFSLMSFFLPNGEAHIFICFIEKSTMHFVESSRIIRSSCLRCLYKTEVKSELLRHRSILLQLQQIRTYSVKSSSTCLRILSLRTSDSLSSSYVNLTYR